MYLNTQQSKMLAELCAVMASDVSKEQLLQTLAQPLAEFMRADHLVSRQWNATTHRYAICASYNVKPSRIRAYEEHFQFCDPITPRLRAMRTPARVSDVCSAQELEGSEFYNDHLRQDGIHWGVNLYAYRGDACLGDLVIYRARGREDFSGQDMACLNILAPVFTAALSRLETVESTKTAWLGHDETELRQLLSGSGLLSQREADVVLLCLNGYSDKDIARQLHIGFTTVRYHLGHAFEKLGVQGRNKLANHIGQLLHQA
jgi:DNA-binding CsgD family transcriptional regulator